MENLGNYKILYPPMLESDFSTINSEQLQLYQTYLDYAKNYMMDIKVSKPSLSIEDSSKHSPDKKPLIPKKTTLITAQKSRPNKMLNQALLRCYEDQCQRLSPRLNNQPGISKCDENPQSPPNERMQSFQQMVGEQGQKMISQRSRTEVERIKIEMPLEEEPSFISEDYTPLNIYTEGYKES